MVMVFSLKSSTAPISCNVCLLMMRSYKGAVAPASYSTMSGVKWIDLLSEYSIDRNCKVLPKTSNIHIRRMVLLHGGGADDNGKRRERASDDGAA